MAPATLITSSSTPSLHHPLSSYSTKNHPTNFCKLSFYPRNVLFPFLSKSRLAVLHVHPPNYMRKTSTLISEKKTSDVNLEILKNIQLGKLNEARRVFAKIAPEANAFDWNLLIKEYVKAAYFEESLLLFKEMHRLDIRPDSFTFTYIFKCFASLGSFEEGEMAHAYAIKLGFVSYNPVGNALLSFYSKLQRIGLAIKLFDEMPNRDDKYVSNALIDMYVKCGVILLARTLFDRIYEKDIFTWTVMIAGYGMHGHGTEAISLFKQMRKKRIKPNEFSFACILYACSHSGLIHEGWTFFDTMRNEYNIEPKLEHYTCMVELLSRAGRLKKAYDFIESMPIKPDSTIWVALLNGCRVYRDVKLAERIAEKVFELEPNNTGFYMLLANIYSEAEKWEEVKRLRERIGRKGLSKSKKSGCSWIEMKGKVHVFVSHKSHPQAKEINEFLANVMKRMKKEENYLLNKYTLLVNEKDREKVVDLCGHNEKFAIGFGVLNSSNGRPIRVAKDTRVCGNCHEVAKFVSKIEGREILLRDSNRFHQFEGGKCSCRGFW
ncbi:hypothetical protein LUZ60_009364 [Juncus effusus]|nr:hypothetical protein LUZ60_009364 [Juncus effusus]